MFAVGATVELDEDDARKLGVVLRKRDGDLIEIFDSAASSFAATLVLEGHRARARLERRLEAPAQSPFAFTLAQALPKGQKMDFVVEKMTELGATEIVPFTSRRAVALHPGDAKVERWRRLAKTAAQQCGRADVPPVADPLTWDALLERLGAYEAVLLPWEAAPQRPLRQTLASLVGEATRIMTVIGPEGGFAHDEVDRAVAAGARPLSLGSRILRTETAGMVVLAALLYERGAL